MIHQIEEVKNDCIPAEDFFADELFCDLTHAAGIKFPLAGKMDNSTLEAYKAKGWKPFDLTKMAENTWYSLSRFKHIFTSEEILDMSKSTMYKCPFGIEENEKQSRYYYGAMPIMLLSTDPDCDKELSDFEKFCSVPQPDSLTRIPAIIRVLNGHGYDDFCSPNDGSGNWVLASYQINSKTILVVRTWDWYNK